jgi:arylsulfatase A-like enzyme
MHLGNKRLWDDTNSTQGTHQKDGVLYAFGNNIKQGLRQTSPVEIYDIVPTVLHSMGLPLPDVFDGRILYEIFEERKEPGPPEPEEGGRARQKLERLLDLILDDYGNHISSRPQS